MASTTKEPKSKPSASKPVRKKKASKPKKAAEPTPQEPEFTEAKLRSVDPKSNPRTKFAKALYLQAKIDKILELAEFATVRQIAAKLEEDGWLGVSRANVGKIIKEHLDEAIDENALKSTHLINLELKKLERREHAIVPNYLRLVDADKDHIREGRESKNADAIEKYGRELDRISKNRSSLLGLNKPVKVEATGADGGPIQTEVITRVILPPSPESEEEFEDGAL